MNKKLLREVIEQIDSLNWKLALYVKKTPLLELTPVYIVNPDSEAKEKDKIIIDNDENYYYLSIHDIQGIVNNAKQQKTKVSMEELIKAVIFYHQNDAFINLNN